MHLAQPRQRMTLLALILLLLTACSGESRDFHEYADERPGIVRVSSLTVPDTPWYDGWHGFADRLAALQGHGLSVELFVTGQLGSEETVLSALRRNRVQLGGFSLHGLSTLVPELSLLLAPYLFESEAQADFVIDRYLNDIYRELLAQRGIELLAWSEVGWNHVYATRPVYAPQDLHRMAMRTSNAEATRLFSEALGARPINITFADLHTALQTGMVNSGQSGIGMYLMTGISQEAPHLLLTGHAYDTGLTVANGQWWQSLSDAQRQSIRRALGSQDDGRQAIRSHLARLQREASSLPNITVSEPTPAQLESWRELGRSTHPAIIAGAGPHGEEIYRLIMRANQEWQTHAGGNDGAPRYQGNVDPS